MTRTLSLWPPSFEGAVFDFDGTVAETAYLWQRVDEAFLGARGLEYTADYARDLAALGFVRGARYTVERFGLREDPDDIVEEWTRMSRALYRTEVRLKPGVHDYILALRALGIPCALATSNEARVLLTMQHVDVDELFDVRVCGNEVSVPKSEPDIYLEAARRMGVAPGRCVVFEDIEAGICSAARAGFATCAVKADDLGQDWTTVSAAADETVVDWSQVMSR